MSIIFQFCKTCGSSPRGNKAQLTIMTAFPLCIRSVIARSNYIQNNIHTFSPNMLAPLARRIALARPVATAFQSRPFSTGSPNNSDGSAMKLDNSALPKDLSEFKRLNGAEYFSEYADASARSELGKIRDIEDEMIATLTAEAEPIDWAHWRKEIKHPTIVDELKVLHNETPAANTDDERARMEKVIEDTFNPMLQELRNAASEAEAEAAEYEKQAEEISYLHDNIADLSVDEFLEKYPTVKASIEKDLQEGKWFDEQQ